MPRTRSKSKRRQHAAPQPTLARALAPEEICAGDFVVVLHEVVEFPSWYWESAVTSREELVRILTTPRDDATPLEVRAVCLPFVLVRQPCGRERMADIRRCRLARLDQAFAHAARRACRQALKKKRRCSAESGATI